MSNIKKLLEGIEVEWKTLGKVAKIKNGKDWKQLQEGNIPVYGSGGIMAYVNTFTYNKPTVLIPRKGSITNIFYVETPIWNVDTIYYTEIDTDLIAPKFFYYYLKTLDLMKLDTGSGRPSLTQAILSQIMIPIPCPDNPEKSLEIQKEIVRILDKFSTLTAELQAELQARKFQYEYYRNQLLTYPMEESDQPSLRSSRSASSIQNSDNPTQPLSTPNPHTGNSVLQPRDKVEWKTLGEIGTLKTGRRFVRTDIQECGVPCFHYGDLYTFYGISTTHTKGYLSRELAKKLRFAQTNDIIIVCAGENDMDIGVGVAWLGEEPAVVHDACCILHHNQNPRYISHFLRTHNYHLQIKKYVKNGKISSLPVSGLEKAIIPIPYPNDREKSLKEQERIASILDKFDTITNSISEGLPKEIELRQKQYEYYRDMLLTFPTDNIKA